MTKVADDLMAFSFKCLKAIYSDLDDDKISTIVQEIKEEKKTIRGPQGSRDYTYNKKTPIG